MKKFMAKKSVMITFIALTIVWLAIYLFVQLRPVAYGMNYTHKQENQVATITTVYNLGMNHKATITEIYEDELGTYHSEETSTAWYLKDGKKIAIGMIGEETNTNGVVPVFKTFEEFEKYAKENILPEGKFENAYNYGQALTITGTAFTGQICHQAIPGDPTSNTVQNCVAYGTIIFSVLGGILISILLAGAVWSTIAFVKNKKA